MDAIDQYQRDIEMVFLNDEGTYKLLCVWAHKTHGFTPFVNKIADLYNDHLETATSHLSDPVTRALVLEMMGRIPLRVFESVADTILDGEEIGYCDACSVPYQRSEDDHCGECGLCWDCNACDITSPEALGLALSRLMDGAS